MLVVGLGPRFARVVEKKRSRRWSRGIDCLRSGWRGLTGQRSEPGQANCLLQRVPSLSKDRYPFFGDDKVRAARSRDSADKVHDTVHGWTFVPGTKQGPPSGVFSGPQRNRMCGCRHDGRAHCAGLRLSLMSTSSVFWWTLGNCHFRQGNGMGVKRASWPFGRMLLLRGQF